MLSATILLQEHQSCEPTFLYGINLMTYISAHVLRQTMCTRDSKVYTITSLPSLERTLADSELMNIVWFSLVLCWHLHGISKQ